MRVPGVTPAASVPATAAEQAGEQAGQRKIEHHAVFGLAHLAQLAHLQVGERRQHAGAQPDHAAEPLVAPGTPGAAPG